MRFTVKTTAQLPVNVQAEAGRVSINGLSLLPHEAAMVGDALNRCADRAETLAAEESANLQPVEA
ncbi:hypothetical protein [Roseateles microcysteis]|uniref:hypothetical protein n=1 Tax=Roseateles microcysteis TaxID=3119057 RepID=UPI002FE5A85D